MSVYLFSVPLVAGKTDTWKKYVQEATGPRRDDYVKSRKRIGLDAEQVFLQQTPYGDACVVSWDTENPEQVFENMAKSDEPFDKWFRDKILIECHNMDLSQVPPINKQVLDLQGTLSRELAGAKSR